MSGGQTGVGRGALDAALDVGRPCGGWCPAGRRAEDGRIPDRYPLAEVSAPGYAARTLRNVLDSDGTVIIHFGRLAGVLFCFWMQPPWRRTPRQVRFATLLSQGASACSTWPGRERVRTAVAMRSLGMQSDACSCCCRPVIEGRIRGSGIVFNSLIASAAKGIGKSRSNHCLLPRTSGRCRAASATALRRSRRGSARTARGVPCDKPE